MWTFVWTCPNKIGRGSTYLIENNGRGGGIRTPGFLLPKQARYQTAPRPELSRSILFYSTRSPQSRLETETHAVRFTPQGL